MENAYQRKAGQYPAGVREEVVPVAGPARAEELTQVQCGAQGEEKAPCRTKAAAAGALPIWAGARLPTITAARAASQIRRRIRDRGSARKSCSVRKAEVSSLSSGLSVDRRAIKARDCEPHAAIMLRLDGLLQPEWREVAAHQRVTLRRSSIRAASEEVPAKPGG